MFDHDTLPQPVLANTVPASVERCPATTSHPAGAPVILHLTASPCYGGTERQMLELGRELAPEYPTVYATFREEERCWGFVRAAEAAGFPAFVIEHDTPRLRAAYRELVGLMQNTHADLLLCHGYKAGILGRLAARRLGIPVVAVSHGWTGESLRVRLFDWIDRVNLRWMDEVVCVSQEQARRVRRCGVPASKVQAICDAVRVERFPERTSERRRRLEALFPEKPAVIVGSAGRLSPEKGFDILVAAAANVISLRVKTAHSRRMGVPPVSAFDGRDAHPTEARNADCPLPSHDTPRPSESDGYDVGFVLFGDGPLRDDLARRIRENGLEGRFVLPGFCDLDEILPCLDLFVLPSYTEGLPNVVLEAFAAGVPVVATAVGGTPEVVEEGANGHLVPPGDAAVLADRIGRLIADPQRRREMGARGRQRVARDFSFAGQAGAYRALFERLLGDACPRQAVLATGSPAASEPAA